MTGEPLYQPAMGQGRVHPLVCSLPHFSTEKWQKPVDQNTLKGKRDIKRAQRQTSRCSNLLEGKTSFRFGASEGERKWEKGAEFGAGLKNGCCAAVFLIPQLCSPYLLLWRKLKCQCRVPPDCTLLLVAVIAHVCVGSLFIKGKELRRRHFMT